MTLTSRQVEAAKPAEKPYKLADSLGLYLYVAPTGLKSWRANYRSGGIQKTRTYGRFPEVSLAQARALHSQSIVGNDAEEDEGARRTFEDVARSWMAAKLPSLSNKKHKIQVENTLERYVFPRIGKKPIRAITRTELASIVLKVQSDRGKVETAHRVAGRITAVFNYAQDIGLIETHGATGLSRVLMPKTVKRPMASLPPEEAGELIARINQYDEAVTRLALMFMMRTFVRVGELRGMRWDELREDGAVWVVPAERMKLRIPHVVPLSTQARAILRELSLINGDSELVFASIFRRDASISENTLLFALYRMGYKGRMTAHGFRALASTVLNEQSSFAHDVIERQLAHRENDQVRAAYNRAQYLDKRRELMQWWSDWIDQQTAARQPATARHDQFSGA